MDYYDLDGRQRGSLGQRTTEQIQMGESPHSQWGRRRVMDADTRLGYMGRDRHLHVAQTCSFFLWFRT